MKSKGNRFLFDLVRVLEKCEEVSWGCVRFLGVVLGWKKVLRFGKGLNRIDVLLLELINKKKSKIKMTN